MKVVLDGILAGILGRNISVLTFFASALWIGSMIGGLAMMAPGFVHLDFQWLVWLPLSPVLLFNIWIIPNAALVAFMLVWYLYHDGLGHLAWGLLVGVESGFILLGSAGEFHQPLEFALAVGCWLVLLVMVETGVWLVSQWRRNLWVKDLFNLNAENARRRAARDAAMVFDEESQQADR